MEFNAKKSAAITFTLKRKPIIADYAIGGTVIPREGSTKYLGVVIDSKLTFADHVDLVCGNAGNEWVR